jgi:hypothetical protein
MKEFKRAELDNNEWNNKQFEHAENKLQIIFVDREYLTMDLLDASMHEFLVWRGDF